MTTGLMMLDGGGQVEMMLVMQMINGILSLPHRCLEI
jgi:hypothetical protein